MDGNYDNSSGVLCCFCNNNIKLTDIDPCNLSILTGWDKPRYKQNDQAFWCHLECFRTKMHVNVQQHLLVDLLSNDKKE